MKLLNRLAPHGWLLAPVVALLFVVFSQAIRVKRIDALSRLPSWSVDIPARDEASSTGYANGVRQLQVPQMSTESYEWIMQAQQNLRDGKLRLNHVDYDNAPYGRETRFPVLYRAWLESLGWLKSKISHDSPGYSIERAALFAEPLLQLIALAGGTFFIVVEFGTFAGALFIVFAAALYPYEAAFVPGAPEPFGFTQVCVLWTFLLLLAGLRRQLQTLSNVSAGQLRGAPAEVPRARTGLFFSAAGVLTGIGVSLNSNALLPVIGAIFAGRIAVSLLQRGAPRSAAAGAPWSLWALCGGLTALALYMVDHFPSGMELRLRENHPYLVIAWLGLEQIVFVVETWIRRDTAATKRAMVLRLTIGFVALAVVATAMILVHFSNLFGTDLTATRLTALDGGVIASTSFDWFSRDGLSARFLATCSPVLLLLGAALLLRQRSAPPAQRALVGYALVTSAVLLVFAMALLRFWSTFDLALCAVLVASTATCAGTSQKRVRWPWIIGLITTLPGLLLLLPGRGNAEQIEIAPIEAKGLIARDLAQWLKLRNPKAVVFAPPQLTGSVIFHGGLRGLITLDTDNRDGYLGAQRILASTTMEEAERLIRQRGITDIVLPSWDPFFEQPGLLGHTKAATTFVEQLTNWNLPPWLRPVPYFLPAISGLESTQVIVFEVVEPTDEASSLAVLTEYFLETGQPERAASLDALLQRFPTELTALVARYQMAAELNNLTGAADVFKTIVSAVEAGADQSLSGDRRADLALALARGGREDLARVQVARCASEFTQADVLSLTSRTLLRWNALNRYFGSPFVDPGVRDLAFRLIPPGSRRAP